MLQGQRKSQKQQTGCRVVGSTKLEMAKKGGKCKQEGSMTGKRAAEEECEERQASGAGGRTEARRAAGAAAEDELLLAGVL